MKSSEKAVSAAEEEVIRKLAEVLKLPLQTVLDYGKGISSPAIEAAKGALHSLESTKTEKAAETKTKRAQCEDFKESAKGEMIKCQCAAETAYNKVRDQLHPVPIRS